MLAKINLTTAITINKLLATKLLATKLLATKLLATKLLATKLLAGRMRALAVIPNKILNKILNTALPPICPLCQEKVQAETAFCSKCFAKIKFTKKPFCNNCSLQFESYVKHNSTCFACLARPPAFEQAFAPLIYDRETRKPILALKHADQTQHAAMFAKIITARAPKAFQRADLITAVPIHNKRLRKRLYNQAALLANHIAKTWHLPVRHNLITREKYTRPLGNLTPRQRMLALRNVFRCPTPELVCGRSVLLIDDVTTSGLTSEFCARVLKKAGAKEVRVLTIAKVDLPRPRLAKSI